MLTTDQIERIASVIDNAKVNGDRDTDEYVDEIVNIIVPPSDVWVVHWLDNHEEPVWVFMSEAGAQRFANTIADPVTVGSEPIIGDERAAEISGDRTPN
jgi:hypothetical protein